MAGKANPMQFLDDIQIQTESGGKQFDKDGKPLVGRYRSGKTPKESEKAYGAGQIQIGTARETAQKHGIPFDEQRLMNDKDYNLQLADRHMGDLLAKYGGDRTLARAAYHSGGGTVDKAIKKYGREGFAQGLGPEGQKYIKMGQGKSGTNATNATNPQDFLDGLASSLGPEAAASGAVTANAKAIFGSDAEFQARASKVEGALAQQGSQIEVLQQVTDAAQAMQVESMTKQVEDTRAISAEIVAGGQELKRQVTPVFAARGRIADKLDELHTMNPLERGLRGIFDLNYDRNYLTRQLDNYDRTLQARSSDFDYVNKLHETAMTEIERRYALDNALPQLAVKQTDEDLGIIGMRIQQTAGSLGSLRDQVSGEVALINAKALAKDDLLTRLDGPTKLTMMTQAQQANGVINHQGVELTYAELRDDLQREEDQELAREGQRMGIANGRADIADKFTTNIARTLSRTQVEAAIANGGVHQGVQLPNDVLQTVYSGFIQNARTQAEVVATTLPSKVALEVASGEMTRITGMHARTKNMFGGAGIPGANEFGAQGAVLVRQLIQATRDGAPPEVIAAITQQVRENSVAMEKSLDKALIQQSGGNKEAAGYLKSFVMGIPIDSAAAVQAISFYATKGARPDGIAMTPESKQIFQQAERIVARERDANPKIPMDRLRQIVAGELTDFASKTIGQSRFDGLLADLPRLAKLANNPLAKVNRTDWQQIQQRASSEAAATIAGTVGVTAKQIMKMVQTGQPLIPGDKASIAIFEKFKEEVPNYNAVENRLTIEGLDDLPQLNPGRRNSTLMIDLMNSPTTSEVVQRYEAQTGSASLGDYFVNPITQGATQANFSRHGKELGTAQSDVAQTNRQGARVAASAYGRDPYKRSLVILGGIEGIGQDGAKALAPFIKGITEEVLAGTGYQAFETGNNVLMRQETAVLQALTRAKFDDPATETYRKLAIKGWAKTATQADGFFDTLGKMLGEY